VGRWLCFLFLAGIVNSAWSQALSDRPDADESFSHFFQRITSVGGVRGINVNPPITVQNDFLYWFHLGAWVGEENVARRALEERGVNLWQDWYVEPRVTSLILPGPTLEIFRSYFEASRQERCPSQCRLLSTLENVDFQNWTTPERDAFTFTFVTAAPIFANKTLLEVLASHFGISASSVTERTSAHLLSHNDFVKAVRKLGWSGEIYFRGLTTEDPQNPHHDVIVLDDDFLRSKTEYTQPLFQALELAGILLHEYGHAFQDTEADMMELNLQIGSQAGAILIEGDAEQNAESALKEASALMPFPNPLALYAAEQSIGIIDKDGQPQFIPYRVGLPLRMAFDGADPKFRRHLYETILGKLSLDDFLRQPRSPQTESAYLSSAINDQP
jgi:hypothetical protein